MQSKKSIYVVPCFNEADRLDPVQFLKSCEKSSDLSWLFVNDGSTDGTLQVLNELKDKNPEKIYVLDLEKNSGKGEAIRRGMLKAVDLGADVTGYFDADLATPMHEILRLKSVLATLKQKVLLGSRVFLLGHKIERKKWRYLLGRAFANVASLILKINIHDTQCGAKYFVNFEGFAQCLEKPFQSRWLFDVELINRVMTQGGLGVDDIYEEPLMEWTDVAGSKIKASFFLVAFWDLFRLRLSMKKN